MANPSGQASMMAWRGLTNRECNTRSQSGSLPQVRRLLLKGMNRVGSPSKQGGFGSSRARAGRTLERLRPLGNGADRKDINDTQEPRGEAPPIVSDKEGRPLAPAYGTFKGRRMTMNGRASVWDNSSGDWLKQLASDARTFLPPLSIVRSRKAAGPAAKAK